MAVTIALNRPRTSKKHNRAVATVAVGKERSSPVESTSRGPSGFRPPPSSVQLTVSRSFSNLVDRRAGITRRAPIPGFGPRLEVHRRDIQAGDNEKTLEVAHGEGGHGQTS